jgi:hypothetical protein
VCGRDEILHGNATTDNPYPMTLQKQNIDLIFEALSKVINLNYGRLEKEKKQRV